MKDKETGQPSISVCMPVYNSAPFIGECISSILSQTFADFEVVVVDDGSTDRTCEIIESFGDPRIRLLRNRHDFISSSNMTLDNARGKYIARMDSDDIMMPDRLMIQHAFMESHPEIDISGGLIEFEGGGRSLRHNIKEGAITARDLYDNCCISNPTAIMRRSSLEKAGLRYERMSIYAEDYLLWARAVIAGLRIVNIPHVLVRYRISGHQVTVRHQYTQYKGAIAARNLLRRWLSRDEEDRSSLHSPASMPRSGNLLTVIIPFLNEGEEVANTVRSVRETAGSSVDIMVINDQSTDGHDYRKDLLPYDAVYFYNPERKGVAGSRDYGVSLCKTPYFILLDAHMRFYDGDWPSRICGLLAADDRRILCCQTRFLYKRDGRVLEKRAASHTYGANLFIRRDDLVPTVKWNLTERLPSSPAEPVNVVLGAGYAASKRYWKRLLGLKGLKYYGNDEAFLSLKAYCEGGMCLLLKDVVIGHIYRDASPYKRYCEEEIYNHLLISEILFPLDMKSLSHSAALKKDRNLYFKALCLLKDRRRGVLALKRRFSRVTVRPAREVIAGFYGGYLAAETGMISASVSSCGAFGAFLLRNIPPDYGVYQGKAAVMVWLCHYSDYSGEERWAVHASEIWEDIRIAIEGDMLCWNFRHGLCGIGWALLYLHMNGLIEEIPDGSLDAIDRRLKFFSPEDCDDNSFATGLGGYFAYMSLRTAHALMSGEAVPRQTRLEKAARNLLGTDADQASYNYAIQYLLVSEGGEETLSGFIPGLHEWASPDPCMPSDPYFWNTSLHDGSIGASIRSIIRRKALDAAENTQERQKHLTR